MRLTAYILLILLSSCLVMSQKANTYCGTEPGLLSYACIQQIGLGDKLLSLNEHFDRTLSAFRIDDNVSLNVVSEQNTYGDDAWITWAKDDSDRYSFNIFVTTDILRNAPLLKLEHLVEHEVCHVKRKHHNVNILITSDEEVEKDAEFCVLKHVGREKYLAYMMHLAPEYPELEALSEEELARRILDIQRDLEKNGY